MGDWLEPSNWDTFEPVGFFTFLIDNQGTAHISEGVTSGNHGIVGGGAHGSLLQTGGSLTLSEGLVLGGDNTGRGQFDFEGGEAEIGGNFSVGNRGVGILNISGGRLTADNVSVGGQTRPGMVHQTGGLLTGFPFSSSSDLSIGQFNGVGEYFLSGGTIQMPSVTVDEGRFVQSGGLVETTLFNVQATHFHEALFQMTTADSTLRARILTVSAHRSHPASVARFRQNEGHVELLGLLLVQNGEYEFNSGQIDTNSLRLKPEIISNGQLPESHFIQRGGQLHIESTLTLQGTTDFGDGRGVARYDMNGGDLDTNRIRLISNSQAVFHQRGGNVRTYTLEIDGNRSFATEATYRMVGGSLTVAHNLQIAFGGGELLGGLDLQSQPVTITTGVGSHIKLGENATIAGGENATLHVGADSLLIVPNGYNLNEHFGNVESDNPVVYHPGEVLHVANNQRVQLAGNYLYRDGIRSEGYVYADLARGSVDFRGQFRISGDGRFDMLHQSEVFVEQFRNAGVFGGSANVRSLEIFHRNSTFTIDNGGSFHALDSITFRNSSVDSAVNELVLRNGTLATNLLSVEGNRGRYLQDGGVATIGQFVVKLPPWNAATHTSELKNGLLKTNEFVIGSGGVFMQTGGIHEAQSFFIARGTYELTGGELNIRGGLTMLNSTSTSQNINFQNSDATLSIEGAIVSLPNSMPFQNARNASLLVDENSLVVLRTGTNLNAIFGSVEFDGFLQFDRNPFTIPATRELKGRTVRSALYSTSVRGRITADAGYGIDTFGMRIRDGAVVDLGNGIFQSGDANNRAFMFGGTLYAEKLSVSGNFYRQSGGDAHFNTVGLGTDSIYRLTGGTLTVERDLISGVIDFVNSSAAMNLGNEAYLNLNQTSLLNAQNATFNAGANSIIVVDPGINPSDLFGEFSTEGLIFYKGETLSVPTGHAVVGDIKFDGGIVNHGTISPGYSQGIGNAIGVLHLSRDYHQEADGRLEIDIDPEATDVDDKKDFFVVNENAWLDGELQVRILGDNLPFPFARYEILHTGGTLNGFFSNAETMVVVPGKGTFDIEYDYNGRHVFLSNFTAAAIPEPGSIGIAVVLILGVCVRRVLKPRIPVN